MKDTGNYNKAVKWLDNLNQNKIIPGLERIQNLMELLENPQDELYIIAIGGTNAKGSTSYSLSNTLMQTGKRIGCFTSPHLHSVRERIKINGKNINKKKFTEMLFQLRDLTTQYKIKATYFEILTAMAYLYFKREKVDYAVMEIGLGGEWDAVNAGNAKMVILTTLGLDHTEYLGNSLDEIALTKAKIVRENSIVITGWEKEYHKHIPKSRELHNGRNIKEWIEICTKNLNLSLKPIISKVPGRQEVYKNFTLDTAHNAQAIKYLLYKAINYQKIILGMLKDKDIESFISNLPKKCTILICNLNTERGAKTEYIADICKKLNLEYETFVNINEAISSIKNEKTLVTGSFYTVAEARAHFKLKGHSEL